MIRAFEITSKEIEWRKTRTRSPSIRLSLSCACTNNSFFIELLPPAACLRVRLLVIRARETRNQRTKVIGNGLPFG